MRVLVFGFDAAESSQIRRIRSLIDSGYDVAAFTMRRGNMNADFQPFWKNIHLFTLGNEQLLRRVAVLFVSCFKILWHRRQAVHADVIMARNFDMLALAFFARLVAWKPDLPIIYECLDIHGSFTGDDWKARMFRKIERFMLNRVQLLVVSSPGFLANYFGPVQHYDGPSYVMENRIWFGKDLPSRRAGTDNVEGGHPWVIGWVGTLRCEPSFSILLETARRLEAAVRIEMHGIVHHHVLSNFDERIAELDNVSFHGAYRYPDGLQNVYGRCDFVWAQDLWQSGANSDWLLPNRIYEAGYFACPSLAVEGTQTGSTVRERGLGVALPEASAECLTQLMTRLKPGHAIALREALLAKPADAFVYDPSEVHIIIEEATA